MNDDTAGKLGRGDGRSTAGGSERENNRNKHRVRGKHQSGDDISRRDRHPGNRHIRRGDDVPSAGGAIVMIVQRTVVVVVVTHPEHDRHAQVEQTNECCCDALLHDATRTVAAVAAKVKGATSESPCRRPAANPVAFWQALYYH